jgi:hypothetical protein
MKKFLIIIALVTFSCAYEPGDNPRKPVTVSSERCKLIDNGGSTLLYIYKVDNHEYIVNLRGGIIHSESCPCKKK